MRISLCLHKYLISDKRKSLYIYECFLTKYVYFKAVRAF